MDVQSRASSLGQDTSRIGAGETVTSLVTIESLERYKEIFGSDLSDEQRSEFSAQLDLLGKASEEPLIPQLVRLLDHIHGTGELSSEDEAFAARIFPIAATVVSGDDVTISTDEVIGPSAPPYFINAGTLTFAGGSLTIMNTVCRITADHLVIQEGGTKPYHVGIMGAPGATGTPPGSVGSSTPGQAQHGKNISPPSPGICTGASDGGKGDPGANGGTGGTGNPGGPGLPSMNANITITALDTPDALFVIATQSGAGGVGGIGGTGGAGQQGGDGGHGCHSACEGTDGGPGGPGGTGGTGGLGGTGGPGTSGLPIQVSFPLAAKAALTTIQNVAPPGGGGAGGPPGAPGAGGNGGSGGKHKSDGSTGSYGGSGSTGTQGNAGTQQGSPAQFSISYT